MTPHPHPAAAPSTASTESGSAGLPHDVLELPDHVRQFLEDTFGQRHTVIRRPPPGMAHQSVAVVALDDGTQIFTKWADQGDGHATGSRLLRAEAEHLELLDRRVPHAERLAYDPDRHVLACRALTGPVLDDRDIDQLEAAAHVLRILETLPSHLATARTVWCLNKPVPDDGPGLDDPRGLAECYTRVRAERTEVLAHADTHADNWLWDRGVLHLIDFSHMCAAPRGFDLVFMVALASADPRARAALLEEYLGRARARLLVGAVAYRTARLAICDTPVERRWGVARFANAVSLHDALS